MSHADHGFIKMIFQ